MVIPNRRATKGAPCFDRKVQAHAGSDASRVHGCCLLDRGYSETDIKKILGGNLMRVMREAEKGGRAVGNS